MEKPRSSADASTARQGLALPLVVTAVAVLAALLVVARPVAPRRLPLPRVDRVTARAERARELKALSMGPLPYEVRAVGEAYRRTMPLRATAPDSARTRLESARLSRLVRRAHETQGARALWRLRTIQAELFVSAVRRWRGGPAPEELLELGGPFAARAKRDGWLKAGRFRGADSDLRALFRVHWNRAMGLSMHRGLRLHANQWREYFHFVLRSHEPRSAEGLGRRLKELSALRSHAPDYPLSLGRGVLLFQAGAFEAAAAALAQHRSTSPRWSLRARNYLAACGQKLR